MTVNSLRRAGGRTSLLAALVLVGVLAAGCSSQPSATTKWADSFCSSITNWQNSLTSAAQSLKSGNLSSQTVQTAANEVKSATTKFADDLKKLGKPPTKANAEEQATINALSTQIHDGVQSIHDSVAGVSSVADALSAVTVVSGTLVTMANEMKSAFQSLQKSNESSELKTAFQQADSCKSLSQANS